ncbi:MAG: hypothetical protein ACRCTZ_13875 [Sarcina sp.]
MNVNEIRKIMIEGQNNNPYFMDEYNRIIEEIKYAAKEGRGDVRTSVKEEFSYCIKGKLRNNGFSVHSFGCGEDIDKISIMW